jgi:lantibiotic leader peptide-processing serine protease
MRTSALLSKRVSVATSLAVLAACSDQPLNPVAPSSITASAPSASVSTWPGRTNADHHVIELKGAEAPDFAATVAALGGRIERRLPQVNLVVVKGLSAGAAAALSARPDIASVTQDVNIRWIPRTGSVREASIPTMAQRSATVDQRTAHFYPVQWNMQVTKANEAWLTTPEGKGARVYVLDTGIDPDHQDLDGKVDLKESRSFAHTEPDDIKDYNFHGTFVSAIVASNGIGTASVSPNAKIVAVKVIDATGSGTFADVIAGIIYAADERATVINMSLGAAVDLRNPADKQLVAQLQAAIAYARFKGAVVVAAAGNAAINLATDPPYLLAVPAELAGVIAVGATGPYNFANFDNKAHYSDYGWNGGPVGGVPLFAPGGDYIDPTGNENIFDLIISPCSEYQIMTELPFPCTSHSYVLADGTSFAAPMVAGEAAVIRSIVGGSPIASLTTNECTLISTDVIGPSAIFGRGRMNVVKAAACANRGAGKLAN